MIRKRVFDLVFSSAGLLVLSPLFVAIAIAIRIDSPGPVFFRQVRMGRGCVPFRIHKFRTMQVRQRADASQITIGHDPRITRTGKILRRLKLDELPQLIDVLRGRMSIVGPRPEVPCYVTFYPDCIKDIIFRVRPGITDESSLFFIDESDLLAGKQDPEHFYITELIPLKNRYHVNYVQALSLRRDVQIIFATFKRLLLR